MLMRAFENNKILKSQVLDFGYCLVIILITSYTSIIFVGVGVVLTEYCKLYECSIKGK